jgi:hypothetical protein
MFAANLVKCLFPGSGSSAGYIVKTLPDAFFRVSTSGNVEQPLIRFGVLHNCCGLSLHSDHNWTFGFFELLKKITRPAPEGGQRLNVFRDIKHLNPSR